MSDLVRVISGLRIAADLLDARETVRTLLGSDFHEVMQKYGEVISGYAKSKGLTVLDAGREIASDKSVGAPPVLLVLAAAVELLDPTKGKS